MRNRCADISTFEKLEMVCPSLVQVRSEINGVRLFIGGPLKQFAAGLRCGSTPPNEHMVRWVLEVTRSIKFGAQECSHPCGGPTSTTKPGLVPWQQAARLLAQGATLPTTTCVLGPPNGQQRMGCLVGACVAPACAEGHAALHGAAGAKGHCPQHPQAH